jgi:hypothetical protein
MLLAAVPIAVSWTTVDDSLSGRVGRHASAVDIMTDKITSSCPCFLMSATIFVTASAFLLVSPLGSLFQIVGIGVFFIGNPFTVNGGAYCGYCIASAEAGIGIVVACTAAALPLIGVAFPWGITKDLKLTRLKGRFITLGLAAQ